MAVSDDNVIYANFGTRKRVTTPDEVNRVEREDPFFSTTASAAARRIADVVVAAAEEGRRKRGRDYARMGHVVGLDVRNGAIHGRVAGSQNEPFAVLIQLPYRDSEDIEQIFALMARQRGAIQLAREGKLSDAVLDILISPTRSDLRLSCTCPDSTHVCKHVVAVGYQLAKRLDADPLLVFSFRGVEFAQLEQSVMEAAQRAATDSFSPDSLLSGEERNELFWDGRELPELPRPQVAPALDDSDPDLLRKAMRSVSHTNIDLLRAISDIEDLYHKLTH